MQTGPDEGVWSSTGQSSKCMAGARKESASLIVEEGIYKDMNLVPSPIGKSEFLRSTF